ncbi:MAG: permease [Candidatus Latescibacteria bacterium]|nr:permease [Candidatus Latescibacterota bacterium]
MQDRTKLIFIILIFLLFYFIPFNSINIQSAILEAFHMVQEYAREHVLFCLIPAFFIAGAISLFISKEAVIKYFGAKANKILAYGIASVSGTILAVCSCTVLPMFAGIYSRGAGIGPASAFLYSGPAINILAIIMTGRILGAEMGIARAVGAVVFSIVIGLSMSLFFRDKKPETEDNDILVSSEIKKRTLTQNAIYFLSLILILIFAAWAKPKEPIGFYSSVYNIKWYLTVGVLIVLFFIIIKWFNKQERKDWVLSTWIFAQQILPLLFAGVFVAGFLLGRPNTDAGIIPSHYVASLVGGNSILANFFASISGAFMYFATLTEVPILQGLLGSGMGKGPALALLLSGPAVSLPSMLVIRSIIGTKKTLTYITLVIILSTFVGWIYGLLF